MYRPQNQKYLGFNSLSSISCVILKEKHLSFSETHFFIHFMRRGILHHRVVLRVEKGTMCLNTGKVYAAGGEGILHRESTIQQMHQYLTA